MLITIIILSILIISSILFFKFNDSEILIVLLILSAVFSSTIIPIVSLRNVGFNGYKANYEMIKEQVQKCDTNDLKGMGIYTEILDINKRIIQCKIYSDNIWSGWFFSNKIADLDIINIYKGE